MEVEKCDSGASWIWFGMYKYKELVKEGTCMKIGAKSKCWHDLWMPTLEGFKVPSDVQIHSNSKLVRDLVDVDLRIWNWEQLNSIFPPNIVSEIMQVKVPVVEYDSPMWLPSKSGQFSIKIGFPIGEPSYLANYRSAAM